MQTKSTSSPPPWPPAPCPRTARPSAWQSPVPPGRNPAPPISRRAPRSFASSPYPARLSAYSTAERRRAARVALPHLERHRPVSRSARLGAGRDGVNPTHVQDPARRAQYLLAGLPIRFRPVARQKRAGLVDGGGGRRRPRAQDFDLDHEAVALRQERDNLFAGGAGCRSPALFAGDLQTSFCHACALSRNAERPISKDYDSSAGTIE